MNTFRFSRSLSTRLFCLTLVYALLTAALPLSGLASSPPVVAHSPAPRRTERAPAARLRKADPATEQKARRAYGQLPLSFEANKGQFGAGPFAQSGFSATLCLCWIRPAKQLTRRPWLTAAWVRLDGFVPPAR